MIDTPISALIRPLDRDLLDLYEATGPSSPPSGRFRPKLVALTASEGLGVAGPDNAVASRATIIPFPGPVRRGRGWPACPEKFPALVRSALTGEWVPARCDSLSCYSCIVPLTIRRAQALAQARPSQWLTLTAAGDGWDAIKKRMQSWTRLLRRRHSGLEYCWQVEENPQGTGSHVHAWVRGPKVDVPAMQRVALDAGLGLHAEVGIAFATSLHYQVPTIEYAFKSILWERPDEPTDFWPGALTYLSLNNGRLTHHSRAFYLGAGGQPLSATAAERDLAAARRGRAWA